MPLTQVQVTTIKQTLIYDNLVHLIIAAKEKLRRVGRRVCVWKTFSFSIQIQC